MMLRVREVVCRDPVPTEAGPLTVTISLSTTHLDGEEQRLRQLLAHADVALTKPSRAGTTGSRRHVEPRVSVAAPRPAG
jgi:hypothetical protein